MINIEKKLEEQSALLERIEKSLLSSKPILNLEEFCEYTGYSKNYAYKMTSRNEIAFYKPKGGNIFFKRAEVDEWLLRNRQKTNEEIADQATAYLMKPGKGGKRNGK